MNNTKPIEIIAFRSAELLERWLAKHHTRQEGIWMRIYKKDSGVKTVTYAEAVDVALCYGWIDGQKNKYDELSWLQKFTPRRPRSVWSKVNTEHAERLIKEGRMKPPGLIAIEAAKQDGRWAKAYQGQSSMKIPDDFLKELNKNKKAKAFFQTLNKVNLYAIAYRLNSVKKSETRSKKIQTYIEMLEKGEKLH